MQTFDLVNIVNKKQIKASITNAIAKLVTGSNRDEIALRVEETYERLLIGASVFAHIPSLTAGSVRREVIANLHRRSLNVERAALNLAVK
jgi:hypothetical protein